MRKYVRPTEEEWLAKRPFQIGASEVATIVGCSKYGNIVDLWQQKVSGKAEHITNTAMEWGHYLEPVVAQMFADHQGRDIVFGTEGDWQFVNTEKEWMSCSPDRCYWLPEVKKEDRLPGNWDQMGLLECKTTNFDPDKTEWLRQSWYCQVQWQLLVAELQHAHLKAICLQDRSEWDRDWDANPEFQANLLELVTKFWEYNVKENVAPTPRTAEEVVALFPKEVEGKSVEADDKVNQIYLDLKLIESNMKQLEEQEKELKGKLIVSLGDAEKLTYNGEVLCTYKSRASNRFDSTAFKKDHDDLYNEYYKQGTTRTFLLK